MAHFNNIAGFSLDNFTNGRSSNVAQAVTNLVGTHWRTKDINLEYWMSGYNLSIAFINYGANPLTVCTFYGGFNSVIGTKLAAAGITTSISNINNFFSHNVDPATLVAGASSWCFYNQDMLPESIRIGLTAADGLATNVVIYIRATRKLGTYYAYM